MSVSERREQYLLKPCSNHVTIDAGSPDTIMVSRAELEREHGNLLARVQQLRRLLGWAPLPTSSELRRQAR